MSIANAIKHKISQLDSGSVFCAIDFQSLGTKGNIDVILHRLSDSGIIRKLSVGLYDKPKKSDILGELTPHIPDIIAAYMRRTGHTIIMDPLAAANALSLTTQVPAKMTFLTNGKSHKINICGIDIVFIHAAPKKLVGADTPIGIIIQSLHYFGKNLIPNPIASQIANKLSKNDLTLLKSFRTKTLQYITPQIDRIIINAATN